MTNELEKQFFQRFGIEPKYYCGSEYIFKAMLENECTDGNLEKCKTCEKVGRTYPQITDHILLELIRIIGKKHFGSLQCENTYSTNLGDARDIITVEADSLKEGLLTLAMQNEVILRIKQQVRTLFEED